jgi:hypothetical protein
MEEKQEVELANIYNKHPLLNRYYIPLTHLTTSRYDNLYDISSSAKQFLSAINQMISDSSTYKFDETHAWNVRGLLDVDTLLAAIYNFEFRKRSGKLLYIAYVKFNDIIVHIIHTVVFGDRSKQNSYEYISNIDLWKKTQLKLEECQRNYPKINFELIIEYIMTDNEVDMKPLFDGKHKEFFDSIKYTYLHRSYRSIIYENPLEILQKWLKEWDVEPDGMGAKAAKEEFEDLAGVKKLDQK